MNLSLNFWILLTFSTLIQHSLQHQDDDDNEKKSEKNLGWNIFDMLTPTTDQKKWSFKDVLKSLKKKLDDDKKTEEPEYERDQPVPRLITDTERDNLLQMIKDKKEGDVIKFFKENSLIDYPLIRFKGGDLHGYTPLAAAVKLCLVETAKALARAQYHERSVWSADIAPGYSIAEIAAEKCPTLLMQVIVTKKHLLAPMIENLDHLQLANIMFHTAKHYDIENTKTEETDNIKKFNLISNWIAGNFDNKVQTDYIDDDGDDGVKLNGNMKQVSTSATLNFNFFFASMIRKGVAPNILKKFVSEKIQPISDALFKNAIVQMIKAGMIDQFFELFQELDKKKADPLLVLAAPFLTPKQVRKLFNIKTIGQPAIASIWNNFKILNLQKGTESLTSLINFSIDNVVNYYSKKVLVSNKLEDNPLALLVPQTTLMDFINQKVPLVQSFVLKKYPRVDTAIEISNLATDLGKTVMDWFITKDKVQVYWTGNDEEALKNGQELIDIFAKTDVDNTDSLKAFLNKMDEQIDFKDLRFDYVPYRLSPLKTAIMLKNQHIVKFLLTDEKYRQSLYASTKFQLSAIEMAACYQPHFLIENILPLFGKKCSERLRMANFVIEMFTETKFQKCPTGAKNAGIVIPALLTSKNPKDLECIDFLKNDLIEEAMKLRFPIELFEAFHKTGHYKNTYYYLEMAVKRSNLVLFKYFENIIGSEALTKSHGTKNLLALWVRYTDGLMIEENIEMLEYLMGREYIDINTYDSTGKTALSLATQRSLVWVMKRLLLVKELNVNLVDIGSSIPTIQHALSIFRNEFQPNDLSGEHTCVRLVIEFLKEMNIPLSEEMLKQLRKGIKPLLKFNVKAQMDKSSSFKDPGTKFDAKIFVVNFENQLNEPFRTINIGLKALGFGIMEILKAEYFLNKIYNSKSSDWIPILLEIIYNLHISIANIEKTTALMSFIKENNLKIYMSMTRPLLELIHSIITEILEYSEKMSNAATVLKLGKSSAEYGLPHNLLLAHPDINTSIENILNLDALYVAKNRAVYLKDDMEAFNEMTRTHIRIRNNFALHDGVKKRKQLVFNVISSIIVGAASLGVIRWMI